MASIKTYRLMNFLENNLALILVAVTVIIVDRIVKFYVTENLRLGESIPVIGNAFMITRSENLGGGFGVMQGQNWLFIGAAALVLALMIYFYNTIIYDRLLVFASAFVLGGTVGNMMDRLFFGRVIDYVNFSFWPTFNISDASLTIGIALFIIYLYRWQSKPAEKSARFEKY